MKSGRAGEEVKIKIFKSASNVEVVSITLDIMWAYHVEES